MNPLDDAHRDKLSGSLEYSYDQLAPFRRTRRDLIEDYAGSRYGQDILGDRPLTYVNLIQDLVRAFKTALAYNDPRYLITPNRLEHDPFGKRFQTALNTYVKKVHFGDTLREIVADAIFQVGIGKTYLEDSPEVWCENDLYMDPGIPYLGRVSLDDFCYDISKSDLRKCQFISNRYTMDFEKMMECPYYDKGVREQLIPSRWSDRSDRWEMAASLSASGDHTDAEIEDVIDLVDVYLPKDRLVCTWAVHGKFSLLPTKPLAILPWDGPELGPFRFLSLVDIPDNVMPTSPAQGLADLFYLFNFLMRRIARRAKQAKTLIPYEPGAGEDVARMMDAQDMQTIKVNRTKSIDVVQFPGPDQNLVSFTYGLQELFKQAGGNLDAMLGTGPSAATVGQEAMIDQRVGAQLAEARKKVSRFAADCGSDIGWMMYDSPTLMIPGQRQIPGTKYSVDDDWLPPDAMPRPVSFSDLEIEVEPMSMEYRSGQQRLGQMFQVMGQIAPLMPLAQQQGYEFVFEEFINDVAELTAEPRWRKWFRSAPPQYTQPGEAPSTRPPGTGQYTRTNVSQGPTSAGRLQMLMQQGGAEQQPVIQGAS